MAAGTYNFVIEQGATLNKVITWKDGNDAAINLTGYTAVAQFRPTIATAPVLTLSSAATGITLGGVAGTITLQATATVTAALAAGEGVWGLELTSAGGVVTSLLTGPYIIVPEVVR
jgi:hypothetical protein